MTELRVARRSLTIVSEYAGSRTDGGDIEAKTHATVPARHGVRPRSDGPFTAQRRLRQTVEAMIARAATSGIHADIRRAENWVPTSPSGEHGRGDSRSALCGRHPWSSAPGTGHRERHGQDGQAAQDRERVS